MDLLGFIIGVVSGFAVGAVIGVLHARRRAAQEQRDLAERAAGLDATLAEVRGQLVNRESEYAKTAAALDLERVNAAKANERIEAAREYFAEQRRQFEQMQERVKETFAALSAAALKNNNEQFVTLADAKMKPLREQLERYEAGIKALEKIRAEAYGGLNEKLGSLQQGTERLTNETGLLVSALRQSGPKGRWGEIAVRRIIELAGMTDRIDFEEQPVLASGQKPDYIIKLPGDRRLAIDSKVTIKAYLEAMAATNEAERKQCLERFVGDVRNTLKQLASREYWKELSPSPEFVVMFMPGEAFFSSAVALDNDLISDGIEQRVILASPSTLIALLMAVRHGWQQQQVAENAAEIAKAGRDLYDRLCTFVKYLTDIRQGIERAAKAYNEAVGNWDSRTEPAARRLKELDAASGQAELPSLEPIDTHLRSLPSEAEQLG